MTMTNLRAALALSTSIIGVLVYITCISITIANDTYIGGIAFPYFSDTGREPPAYYVFAVGLTILAFGYSTLSLLQYSFVKGFEGVTSCHVPRCNSVAVFFGFIGSFCAALVGWFSTEAYPDLHNYSAYVFFIFSTVYICLQTTIYKLMSYDIPSLTQTANIKLVICIVFSIAFVIYIPVGLALAEFLRLPLEDCLALQLDDCEGKLLEENSNLTTYWDYTSTYDANMMRSISQFVAMISIMAFYASFAFDPRPDQVDATDVEKQ